MMDRDIKELQEKTRQFCKLAGILQVPPKLLKEVSEYMVGCYSWSIVNYYNTIINEYPTHPDKSYWLMIRAIAQRKVKEQEVNSFNKEFEFSIDSLPYQDNILPAIFWKGKSRRWILKTHFRGDTKNNHTIYNREGWVGLWKPSGELEKSILLGDLYIARDTESEAKIIAEETIKTLHRAWDSVRETVRHELQHLMQDLLKYLLDLMNDKTRNRRGKRFKRPHNEMGGLPGRKYREKERDPSGYLLQVEHGVTQNTDGDPHELRDIEFYTRLADDIGYYKKFRQFLPTNLHADYLKAWVGEISREQFIRIGYGKGIKELIVKWKNKDKDAGSQLNVADAALKALGEHNLFFLYLKRFSPMKWKKAVKEFVKSVG